MTVRECARALGLTPYHLGDPNREVSGGYAGDLLSWVISRAEEGGVWLTIMSSRNVAAVAELAGVACVVLTEGVAPSDSLAAAARERGLNLLGSGLSTFALSAALADLLE
ncbi:hypothetical protein CE91St41_06970 [Oscillospiraceae bacterium]|nr:hypothetical protein CE91St40_06970 [Oscillospiraceae bacterium]BDF73808.1 hypothetical protein CE91St41_06970 [Oscillospiraceae bacterium]